MRATFSAWANPRVAARIALCLICASVDARNAFRTMRGGMRARMRRAIRATGPDSSAPNLHVQEIGGKSAIPPDFPQGKHPDFQNSKGPPWYLVSVGGEIELKITDSGGFLLCFLCFRWFPPPPFGGKTQA
jgi:hypothetical protein